MFCFAQKSEQTLSYHFPNLLVLAGTSSFWLSSRRIAIEWVTNVTQWSIVPSNVAIFLIWYQQTFRFQVTVSLHGAYHICVYLYDCFSCIAIQTLLCFMFAWENKGFIIGMVILRDHLLLSKVYWQMAKHAVCWSMCLFVVSL